MECQVYNETVQRELETHYKAVLALLGEDTEREGLQKTQVQGRLPSDGDSERHRFLLFVRTSHAAFLRESACGLYTQWIHYGVEQDCPCGGQLFPSSSGTGKDDAPDSGLHSGSSAHVYADAWSGKAKFGDYDQ